MGARLPGWGTSSRRGELPDDWQRRRDFVRARAGGRCEAALVDGTRCPAAGTDCDHRDDPMDHRVEHLQWLCPWHHKRKTQRESAAALRAVRAANLPAPRRHPGLIE
jgi:5-methylcytosine-specific restriction protein A